MIINPIIFVIKLINLLKKNNATPINNKNITSELLPPNLNISGWSTCCNTTSFTSLIGSVINGIMYNYITMVLNVKQLLH